VAFAAPFKAKAEKQILRCAQDDNNSQDDDNSQDGNNSLTDTDVVTARPKPR
jgi:hypothetical protein